MPTVLRVTGFRLYFYSHEPNEPPHVHVDSSGASAKELGDVLRLVQAHQAQLLEAWHDFFRKGGIG